MSSPLGSSRSAKFRLLIFILVGLGVVALVQQQILLRRLPQLRSVAIQSIRSGAAALDVRFSRPMNRELVAEKSRLIPAQLHQWFGQQNRFRLLLDPGAVVRSPQQLILAGDDRRGFLCVLARFGGTHVPIFWLWWSPRMESSCSCDARMVDGCLCLQFKSAFFS